MWGAWSALEFGSPAVLVTYLGGAYAGAATGAGPIAITVAVLYSVGALAALYVLRRFRERPVAAWAVVTTLTLGLTMTLLLDWLDARKGYRHVIASLGEAMPESYRCVASDGLGEPQRAMLDYYLDVQTHRLSVFPDHQLRPAAVAGKSRRVEADGHADMDAGMGRCAARRRQGTLPAVPAGLVE